MTERGKKPELILNIYGQEAWHTEARIVGSIEALQVLKDALNEAIYHGYVKLPKGESIDDALFASDGEGYDLEIYCLGDWDDARWKLHTPDYRILEK